LALGTESTVEMLERGGTSDANLAVGIGRWSESALSEVYRRHSGAVHALAQRVLGPGGRAQDVTQDVFVDLWKRPERFDPARGSLRSFLVTVAHSRAVDIVRSDVARAAREQRIERETAAGGYDLETEVWDLTLADQVKEAVGALPEPERRVIELAYFGGHTYREVASMLGEPEGTVKSRIRRGLRRLRNSLADEMAPAWSQP
jgi:RNA polymerase sigma-70 factor, ECF subfamily